jgi:hypothetical protein
MLLLVKDSNWHGDGDELMRGRRELRELLLNCLCREREKK